MFKHNPLAFIHMTSNYGTRYHPVTGEHGFHNGIDLRANINTPLLAVEDGIVRVSKANNGGPSKGLGWYLVVEHPNYCTVYAHMHTQGRPVGTKVKANEIIGYSGNSGVSSGPHLHFEVRLGKHTMTFWQKDKNGKYLNGVDPKPYLFDKTMAEWERILRSKVDSPDAWLKFIDENKDHPVGRFLPQLIEKIGG